MRNILQQALNVSLESADPLENAELNPVTETTTVAVDEVLEEIREGSEVVEEHDDAVEELEGAAESLESLIASLESAIADGGMSPQAADIHGRAMHIAMRRLPISAEEHVVSTESFGGSADKLQASMEALEGAKNALAKIWEAIKNVVSSALDAIVNFVKSLGNSAPALKRAAAILKQKASKMTGEPKEKTIDGKAISNALFTKGEVSTAGEVVTALNTLVDGGKKVVGSAVKASMELKNIVAYTATGRGTAEVDYVALNKDLPREVLPGGAEIKIGESGIPTFQKGQGGFDKESKITVADGNGVRNIAAGIESIAKMLETFAGRDFKKLDDDTRKYIKEQDAVVKKLEAEKDVKKDIQKDLKEFRKVSSIIRSVGPQYMAHAAKCAKAAYAFANKCAAQYA